MAVRHLKNAQRTPATDEGETREIVSRMLGEIERRDEERARIYGRELDRYTGPIVVGCGTIERADGPGFRSA